MLVTDTDTARRAALAEAPCRTDPGPLRTLLAALAGQLPDELLSTARQWLAEARLAEVARSVTYAAVHHRVPLTETHRDALVRALLELGVDPIAVRAVEPADHPPALPYEFGHGGWCAQDPCDDAVVDVIAVARGAEGLWRAWRTPIDGAPWPAPKRVYLVQAAEDTDLVALGARVQSALHAVGEPHPQVETYSFGQPLGAYQITVRRNGELLWMCPDPG